MGRDEARGRDGRRRADARQLTRWGVGDCECKTRCRDGIRDNEGLASEARAGGDGRRIIASPCTPGLAKAPLVGEAPARVMVLRALLFRRLAAGGSSYSWRSGGHARMVTTLDGYALRGWAEWYGTGSAGCV